MDSTTHTTTTVEFVDWRTKAKEKLEAEDKLFKGGRAAASVQSYVLTLKRIARPCSSTSPMLKSRFR